MRASSKISLAFIKKNSLKNKDIYVEIVFEVDYNCHILGPLLAICKSSEVYLLTTVNNIYTTTTTAIFYG